MQHTKILDQGTFATQLYHRSGNALSDSYYADNDPDDTHKPSEIALWRAVILQAFTDAKSGSKKREDQYHKRQAQCWLTGMSKDFITVCFYAGYCPFDIRKKAERLLSSLSHAAKL